MPMQAGPQRLRRPLLLPPVERPVFSGPELRPRGSRSAATHALGLGSHRLLKDRNLFFKNVLQSFLYGFQVEPQLQVEPESLARTEEAGQSQCGIGRDAPFPVDNLVDAPWGNADFFGQSVLADSERIQKLLQEDFARVDWVKEFLSHFTSPCGSRRSRPRSLHRLAM